MKLSSEGIEFQGVINVELPQYMQTLTTEEITEIQRCDDKRIISCGIHPVTKELMTIDQHGKLYELMMVEFFGLAFETVSITPINKGKHIELDTGAALIEAESEEIIAASKSCGVEDLTINISV